MKKKIFITLLISLFIQNLIAQKVSNENERKWVAKMIYDINDGFFNSEKQKFKTIVYNPEDFFSKPFSIKEADSCFKLMDETAQIEIENNRLYFVADILSSLNNSELRSSLIEINKYQNRLFYNKDSLKLKGQGGGNKMTGDRYQITRNYPLKSEQSDIEKIYGSLVMQVDFLIGYDTASLTKNDIQNNEIKIGDDAIELVDVLDNKIVLRGETKNVNLINFISKNKIARPLTLNDEGYDSEKLLSFSSIMINKSVYENMILKKISKDEFDKLMSIEKLNGLQNQEQFQVIKNVTKIGNKFILYKPRYKTYYLTVNFKDNNE